MKLTLALALATLTAVPTFAASPESDSTQIQLAAAGHFRLPQIQPIDPEDLRGPENPEPHQDQQEIPEDSHSTWSFKHWTLVAPYGTGVASIPLAYRSTCDKLIKSLAVPGHSMKPICVNGLTGEIYTGQ